MCRSETKNKITKTFGSKDEHFIFFLSIMEDITLYQTDVFIYTDRFWKMNSVNTVL